MSELLFQEKTVVVPGDVVARGMEFFPGAGTYRKNEEIIAEKVGLLTVDGKVIKLIPLAGGYIPKAGDVVIAQVFDLTMSGWLMKTNTPYTAMLNVKDATSQFIAKGEDLTKFIGVGEFVVTKIFNVTSQMLVDLTMKGPGLRKLSGGQIIQVSASKVPRIVGKAGSMVSMIKKATNCHIVVGQNGFVWVKGSPVAEVIAVETIRMIEKQAHIPGLTERVQQHLDEATNGVDIGELPEDDGGDAFPRERRGSFGDRDRSYGDRDRSFGGDRRGPRNFNNDRRGNGGRRPQRDAGRRPPRREQRD